jgi:putative endonuclease
METWTVYLLRCADKTVYTGCTNNFPDRLSRHSQGSVHYTRTRLPVEVILTIEFRNKYLAFDFERYLKSGSGKEFSRRHFLRPPEPPNNVGRVGGLRLPYLFAFHCIGGTTVDCVDTVKVIVRKLSVFLDAMFWIEPEPSNNVGA